jgi:hypothetical protein
MPWMVVHSTLWNPQEMMVHQLCRQLEWSTRLPCSLLWLQCMPIVQSRSEDTCQSQEFPQKPKDQRDTIQGPFQGWMS